MAGPVSAVSAIGFAIAVVAQARNVATSIDNRIENYRKGCGKFQKLRKSVDLLDKQLAKVEELLRKFPEAVPADVSDIFEDILAAVRGALESTHETMKGLLSKAFEGGSSAMGKVKSMSIRVVRAQKLSSIISAEETNVDRASNKLSHLITQLSNSLKIHDAILPKLENLAVVETADDIFDPGTIAPALNETVKLNFEAKDAEGKPITPEGTLKHFVISSESSSSVTAATGMPKSAHGTVGMAAGTGVLKSAYGVVGMAGVGKTIALQGLAYDKDVQFRFPDGVFFMTLGQGATSQTVLRELAKLLTLTGANKIASIAEKCTVLRDAVDYAARWFGKRICLFLVDDIWPTSDCRTGFLKDLRQLLRDSPNSRMAISTRSIKIAQCAGAIVKFGAREPRGSASMEIFMAHATQGRAGGTNFELGSKSRNSIAKILEICAGLPIALAVTGSTVAHISNMHGDSDIACESYATRLEKKRSILGDEDILEGTSLNAGIFLSLEFLEAEFVKWEAKTSQVTSHSISDMYTGLCVLENQAWVSVFVLGRLWGLEKDAANDVVNMFCEMSLARLDIRQASNGSSKEAGIILHDLQLDFCQRQAEIAKTSSRWHTQLLNGYLEAASCADEEPDAESITSFTPRWWWANAVPEDGYIYFNLSRHLACAGQGLELAELLLEGRWMELRGKYGGILGLVSDFGILDCVFAHWERSRGPKPVEGDVRRQFDQICKAIQLSWGRMIEGLRAFQFQVCTRLVSLRKRSIIANAFVESMEKCTPKPFLLPVNSFFPELDNALIMEIPVGGECFCVACSPCGQYVAAASGSDIVVAKSSTGAILQNLRGHKHYISCLSFATGSSNIVSGSRDKTVMVWEWESSESPVHVLEGHDSIVSGVAISSEIGKIISSSDDKTVRIWDMMTGARAGVLPQSDGVLCVAVCGKGEKIAIGLDGGRVKILDSITNDVLFEDTAEHGRDIECISFSPDGSCLAAGSWDNTVQMWNTQTWTKAGAYLEGHEDIVTSVSFRADGKQLASSSFDDTIRLWDVESGNCVGVSSKYSEMESVSFIGDGEKLISGSRDGIVRIWDACLGKESIELTYGHTDRVIGVAISQNGMQVASASVDGTVRLWDTRTGKQIGKPMEGHTDMVRCVSFSPDGRWVVSGSGDDTLRLWDTETQTQVGDPFEGHTHVVLSVSFSCEGLRIVSGSQDKTVRIWNAETHQLIGEALEGHVSPVDCVSESADGCHIVSQDWDENVIIWNRENQLIVWKSKVVERECGRDSIDDERYSADISNNENNFENEIGEDEAERIIRRCGQQTPYLWPKSFPLYAAELYCKGDVVYSTILGENTLLADLDITRWTYHTKGKLFAAGLYSGAVAICKLNIE